jgi:AraC-like DNA-binding protein
MQKTFASPTLLDSGAIFAYIHIPRSSFSKDIRMLKQVSQKPRLLKIIAPVENSIVIKGDEIAWNNPWHYHPEIELLYCIKGKGTNFIGNSIRNIEEGELLLLGENLPHTRQRDKDYYLQNPEEKPETIVIQFKKEFLGADFFNVKEFAHITGLFSRALRGLKFGGETREKVIGKLEVIGSLSSTSAVIELLSILDELARSSEFQYLNGVHYVANAHEKSSQAINKVYLYTIEHFREPIKLEDVAALTNHSPAAFCRYFKSRTRKTYFQYLTEVRVGYACEKLMEGSMDITRICYASGFNNLSNFHKQFRKVMKETPSEYRARSLKKMPA